jgi:hypothetical protein
VLTPERRRSAAFKPRYAEVLLLDRGLFPASASPKTLGGEVAVPVSATRLDFALARWDIQAHRTLATSPGAADLRPTSARQ